MSYTPRFHTLVEVFEHATQQHAARPLFGTKRDGHWDWTTYGEFAHAVTTLRGGLAAKGIVRGDRVAVIADNCVEWAVACYASALSGAQWVPMYEAQLERDWAYILRDCGAKALFVANRDLAGRIAGVRDQLPDLEHVFVLHEGTDFADLQALGAASPLPPVSVEPEDVAGFIYTSGTTGDPKGVLLTQVVFVNQTAHQALCEEGTTLVGSSLDTVLPAEEARALERAEGTLVLHPRGKPVLEWTLAGMAMTFEGRPTLAVVATDEGA